MAFGFIRFSREKNNLNNFAAVRVSFMAADMRKYEEVK
jgi:hypothetical protein